MSSKLFVSKALQDLLPPAEIAQGVHESGRHAILQYFHEKYGEFPTQEQMIYPLRLASMVDIAVRRFIKKNGLRPFALFDAPKRVGALGQSYYSEGHWYSQEEDLVFSINVEVDGMHYAFMANTADAVKRHIRKFSSMADKQFKNKIIAMHDDLGTISPKQLEAPSWAEIKDTIDPYIAGRIEKVVLPFYDRLGQFKQAGVAPRLGVLMHGGAGTGKTYLVRTLIREMAGKATIAHVSADQFYQRHGAPIRSLVKFLHRFAPLFLIIEDIELLARSREALLDNPTVQAMLDIMDGAVNPLTDTIIVATTNVMDQLDPAFKRPGRFDEVWGFTTPSSELAMAAVRSHFSKAVDLEVPEYLVKACGDAGLTYAELRFVATEIIRRAIETGSNRAKVTKEEWEAIVGAAKAGNEKRPVRGFERPDEFWYDNMEPDSN